MYVYIVHIFTIRDFPGGSDSKESACNAGEHKIIVVILYNIYYHNNQFSCSVVSDSDPMDCSMPAFPVHHQLPDLAQTHVHQVGDAIQPSHLLSSPSSPAFSLLQHQSFLVSQFFPSGGQNTEASASASVLSMNIQD